MNLWKLAKEGPFLNSNGQEFYKYKIVTFDNLNPPIEVDFAHSRIAASLAAASPELCEALTDILRVTGISTKRRHKATFAKAERLITALKIQGVDNV